MDSSYLVVVFLAPGMWILSLLFFYNAQDHQPESQWVSISRHKFFTLVWGDAFFWFFVPGLLVPTLSYFNVIACLAPKIAVVSNLVGTSFLVYSEISC